jgi:hypothetical protein
MHLREENDELRERVEYINGLLDEFMEVDG